MWCLGPTVNKVTKYALFGVWAVALLAVVMFVFPMTSEGARKYTAPLADGATVQVNAEELSAIPHRVVPEMLATIYLAFGETDESAIYDKLALVSAGQALETLYLERVGAMVGGGLDEADQTLHEMELIGLESRRADDTLTMNVKWRAVGTVGHATHLHVRGNTYSANLTIEPAGGAWRMVAFDLTDVDRTDAGTQVAAQ